MGWAENDAFTEAENFGCVVPLQRAFIQEFATRLTAGLGRYPLEPLGSVRATPAERDATLEAVAAREKDGVE